MTDFDLALGRLLAVKRERKNLTQVALAKKTGVSQARISRIESGVSPTLAEFERLAPVLAKDATTLQAQARRIVDIAHKETRMIFFPEALTPIVAADVIPLIASRMP